MPRSLSPSDATAWLRLSYASLPTPRLRALLHHYQTPQAIFGAEANEPVELRAEFGLSEAHLTKLRAAASKDVTRPLEAMEEHAIWIATQDEFPSALRTIGDDVPAFLFVRGEFSPRDERTIAVVGTRNVTEYGRGLAHTFGVELARAGWTVASGLARGIDTAAHKGALDGGGRTLAATGCGLDIVYPSENRELMSAIEGSGAVVSEWAPTTPPEAWHFPARNRIIVGLSRAVIVVEAQQKSGALITANLAAEHDRTVFAVPGNVHKAQSRGPHQLIKEGAVLIESIQDCLDYLGSEVEAFEKEEPVALARARRVEAAQATTSAETNAFEPQAPAPGTLPPNEMRVYLALEHDPRHMDDLAEATSLELGPTNAALVMLELKGFARRLPGNLFVKVAQK